MPLVNISRRSRFKRTSTGKCLFLTERDAAIFRLLYRYRYLRATQVVAFLKPKSEKRLIERLGDLYHETGLIDRPVTQWRRFDARYRPIIYELSAKGLAHLEACGPLPQRAVTFATKDHAGRTPQFDHAMMIVDALVEAELGTVAKEDRRFVPVDEILARMPEKSRQTKKPLAIPVTIKPSKQMPSLQAPISTHVIPDALYGIGYRQIDGEWLYRFFALEAEHKSPKRRSTAKLSSLVLKQVAYGALIQSRAYREVWSIPNLSLHVVSGK
jgi:hypothetical protein